MADNENASGDPQDVTKGSGGVAALVETVEKMNDSLEKIGEKQTELEKGLQEATKVQYPYGPPNGDVHGIRKGEDPMTSRPYSLTMVCKRLAMQRSNEPNWQHIARPEAELSEKLRKAYYNSSAFNNFLIPLGSDLMPIEERTTDDGVVVPGVPKELRKECADMMRLDSDPDLEYLQRLGLPIRKSHVALQKDLSANTATTGGTLVAAAAQGELINVLRAQEFFSQVGAQQMDLPPQGAITFPRVTGSVTISAFAEAATVTESTPATSQLRLAAKAYSGLVDIPDELIKFASVNVEAWLRSEFTRELALKADRDMINGSGGTAIQGAVVYSGARVVVASTTGANGDTLEARDPTLLFADIADQDAPVEMGFFFGLTNTLWGALSTRQEGGTVTNPFIFAVSTQSIGAGMPAKSLNGVPVVATTQIPTNRAKGSGTDLTLLFGGVGPEWVIARSGVVDLALTQSDASKFASRLQTMRGTVYIDAGPMHEESFGMVDDVTNS